MNHVLLTSTFLATLAFAPGAFTQEAGTAPRDLLERAHYAENHEHDLAAAKSGYQAALDAATARGESDVAAEAGRALERVRVRLGEVAAPAQQEVPSDLVDLFSMASTIALDDARGHSLANDMALYGDRATPILAEWLALQKGARSELLTTTQRTVVANPYFAAQALGVLGTPMARAALLDGLDSPDPLLRRTIIAHARADHGALFAKAIDDPIDALRERAALRLVNCTDPSVAPALEVLVRRGSPGAEGQLAQFDPVRALQLTGDGSLPPERIDVLDSCLRSRDWKDLQPLHVEHFLAAASAALDSRQRRLAKAVLPYMVQSKHIDGAVDRAGLVAAFEHALVTAAPEFQVRYSWVLGPVRAQDLLEQYLASSTELLTQDQDDQVKALAKFCIERGSDRGAIAERLFAPILARSEIARVATARPGTSFPTDIAATLVFGFAITTPVETALGDARVLRMFEAIPAGARYVFHPHLSDWLANRLPRDSNLIEPGSLEPRFVELAVSFLSDDKDGRWGHLAASIARAIGTSAATEELIARTNFPYGCSDQWVRQLARVFDAESAARLTTAVIEASRPIVGDAEPNRRASQLIQFGFDLGGTSKRDFMLAVWALPLSEQLRTETYYRFSEWENNEDALPTLLELYPTLPETAGAARSAAIRRFGTNLYEPAIDLLGEALRDRDLGVRTAAQEAFQRFREHREALEEYEAWRQASDDARETVAELVKLLASDDRDVVRGAVEALGAVKARTALPQLVALLGRDDAELKAAVTKAIAAIGG